MSELVSTNHRCDSAGLTYIYPVISRRLGGLSIGINLNSNNACNWQCVYCQVPNLIRGAAPLVDLTRLMEELRGFLKDVLHGDFYKRFQIYQDQMAIKAITVAGNGEPTSCNNFNKVIKSICEICHEIGLLGKIRLVIITNGSLIHKQVVREGLAHWADFGGEVWFKVDSATAEGIRRINHVSLAPETILHNLELCTRHCPTWIQTCMFSFDGEPPSKVEQQAYFDFLLNLHERKIPICGVLLYGLARQSMQDQAWRLSPLPSEWLTAMAQTIEGFGIDVKMNE